MEEKVRIQTCTKTVLKIDFFLHLGFDSQDGKEPPIPQYLYYNSKHEPIDWLDKFEWKLDKATTGFVSYIKNRLKLFSIFFN